MDPVSGVDDFFGIGSVMKNKCFKRDETLSKGRCSNNIDVDGSSADMWKVTLFLTPPSSPSDSPSHDNTADERDLPLFLHDRLVEDDDVFKTRSATDLKSMLIKDCMWNGYTLSGEANKTGSFEKFRSLTKTPPLVDCSLFITYVDPSEIWPFSLSEQVKAANRTGQEELAKPGGGECLAEEDVEIDVVGLEGTQKVHIKKEENDFNNSKECMNCEKDSALSNLQQGNEVSPLTPSTSDDEYSCKLRSCGIKRSRSTDSENDKENCNELQGQRVSSEDESDQDCELGRATHNVLERKRRNELKQRFQYLRDSIPEIACNDRAPKVAILQKAFAYITYLKMEEKTLIEESRKQRNVNAQLRKRMLELQALTQ